MAIIFWDFLMFYQIFFLFQVKWSVIIGNKHGIYELPEDLPNNLRLRILENKGNIRKISKCPHYSILAENSGKKRTFPVVRYSTEQLEFVSSMLRVLNYSWPVKILIKSQYNKLQV